MPYVSDSELHLHLTAVVEEKKKKKLASLFPLCLILFILIN